MTNEQHLKEAVSKMITIDFNDKSWWISWWMLLDPEPSFKAILSAMDAAREDEAVGFRVWCDENHWVRVAPDLYSSIYDQDFSTTEYNAISLKDLYARFTNSRTTQ